MFTAKQIAWAAQHDWFVSANRNGSITVRDGFTIAGLYAELIGPWQGSFAELRAWAGY